LRFTPGNGTAVTQVTLAVDKYNASTGKNEADFIQVIIWGKQAENTANYMSKGRQMAIGGRLKTRSYDAKDGTKRYVTEVVASEVHFVGGNNKQSTSNTAAAGMAFEEDMIPVDDSDMPF